MIALSNAESYLHCCATVKVALFCQIQSILQLKLTVLGHVLVNEFHMVISHLILAHASKFTDIVMLSVLVWFDNVFVHKHFKVWDPLSIHCQSFLTWIYNFGVDHIDTLFHQFDNSILLIDRLALEIQNILQIVNQNMIHFNRFFIFHFFYF